MKNFIVYDNKGVILRTGTCSDIDLALHEHIEKLNEIVSMKKMNTDSNAQ